MNKCIENNELLAFIEGELDKESAAAVQEHLQNCNKCTEVLKAWDSFNEAFSWEDSNEDADNFVAGVMQRIVPEHHVTFIDTLKAFCSEWQYQLVGATLSVILLAMQPTTKITVDTDMVLLSGFDQMSSAQLLQSEYDSVNVYAGGEVEEL